MTGTQRLSSKLSKQISANGADINHMNHLNIIEYRNNPKFDLFKEFGVIEEDVQYIRVLLHQTSVQNKEISVQIKATVENKSQMYKMKLHTLWSPMKKDV